MSAPLLRAHQLRFAYPGEGETLAGVDLALAPGEFLALIGPNGSGKTTLAKLLVGLLQPDGGQVQLGELDLRQLPVSERARRIGYVFQNPDHQLFGATVREELALGPRYLKVPEPEMQARLERCVRDFGLSAMLDRQVGSLSYGERKTLSLAAVAMLRPRIWILDEPTTGLHWQAAHSLLNWLAVRARAGDTVLLITHDMRQVAEYAGRAALMVDGRIVAGGAPHELFAQTDVLRRADLQPPYIVRLAHQLGMPAEVVTVQAACEAYWSGRG